MNELELKSKIENIIISKTSLNNSGMTLDHTKSLIDDYGINSLKIVECMVELEKALKLQNVDYANMPLSTFNSIETLYEFYSKLV